MRDEINTENILNIVKKICGSDAWSNFQEETRTGILTSEICFSTFKDRKDGFDFSSAIVPIMKGLELELFKMFYEPYYCYIKENYSAQSFSEDIWASQKLNNATKASRKRKILYCNNRGELNFQKLSKEFTIGDFRYTVSDGKVKKIKIDKPFVDYLEKQFFSEQEVSRGEIEKWVSELIRQIEGLRQLRNDSTHGGKTQNCNDAFTAISTLIEENKLLPCIVSPITAGVFSC